MKGDRLDNMKKLNLFIYVVATLCCFGTINNVHAEGTTLPDKDSQGIIKLEDDINLENTFVINEDENITIDLAGHTINYNKGGTYAINNLGTGKIIDSSTGKTGKILCSQNSGSCVRNYKNLEIDGVFIQSEWLTVKNEEASELNIKNSKIVANLGTKPSVAIQNWGSTTIDNSEVVGNGEGTIAISEWSSITDGVVYNSDITIKNTTLNAPFAVDSRSYNDSDSTQKIVFENVEVIDGDIKIEKGVNFIADNASNTLNAIKNATAGATIVVSNDFVASNLTIPSGVNIELGENNNDIEKVIGEDGTISFIRKKSNKADPTPTDEVAENENPDTSDINLYLILVIIITSGFGICYTIKQRKFN